LNLFFLEAAVMRVFYRDKALATRNIASKTKICPILKKLL
jgi:hypothetical protein